MTDEAKNFQQDMEVGKTTIAFFSAPWCTACPASFDALDRVIKKCRASITVRKIDVQLNNGLSNEYGVRTLPTILFCKNGDVKHRRVGSFRETEMFATDPIYDLMGG